MDDLMHRLIISIEAEFPELRWLLRSTDASDTLIPGAYFAHICNANFSKSYQGVERTPFGALSMAFEKAKLARADKATSSERASSARADQPTGGVDAGQ